MNKIFLYRNLNNLSEDKSSHGVYPVYGVVRPFKVAISLLFTLFFCQGLFANHTGVSFLKIPPSTSLNLPPSGGGIEYFWMNPAGAMSGGEKLEAIASYNLFFEDVKMSYAACSIPIQAGNFALSVTYLDSGDIFRTTDFSHTGDGSSFDAKSTEIKFGYSGKVRNFRFGFSLSNIIEEIDEESATGGSLAAGLLADVGNFNLSFSLKNFGWMTEMDEKSSDLPITLNFAAARKFGKVTPFASLSKVKDEDMIAEIGGIGEIFSALEIYGGFRNGYEEAGNFAGASLGARVRFGSLSFLIDNFFCGDLGNPLRISLKVNF